MLRGPQGTLFGRNAIGGVINIRRTRPTGDFGVKAEFSYGQRDSLVGRAVVNIPLIDDLLSAKAFYFHNETDGHYRDFNTGERRGFSNNDNFGVTLMATPGDLEMLLTVEKQIQRFDPVVAPISRTGEVFCGFQPAVECDRNTTSDLYTVFNDPKLGIFRAPSVTLELNYDFGPVTLTSITGHRSTYEDQGQDFDGSSVDLFAVRRFQDYEQFSQEIRLSGDLSDTLDYVVGGYYFDSNYDFQQFTKVFGFDSSIDPFDFDSNPQIVRGEVESYAVFGDFNWEIMPSVRLSFGGRYTRDRKSLRNEFLQLGVIGDGRATFEKFTPKIGIDWKPNDDVLLYASYQQGFRSGGFSPRAQTAETAGTPFQPETVDSLEAGSKLDLGMVKFNLAVFYSTYDDLQQNTTIPGGPTTNQTITGNVGSADIWGIEADFSATPFDNFVLNGSIGYLNSDVKDFLVNDISPTNGLLVPFDLSNNDLIYNPEISASLSGTYTVPLPTGSLVLNTSYRFIGRYDQQISLGNLSGDLDNGPIITDGNDPRVRTDQQNLVDASARFNFELGATDAWFTVWGRNVLDDRGPTHGFTVAGLWAFGTAREPQTFGATVGVKY